MIKPSDSDYSRALVMVRKSDGTYRMCIDYRDVNARTIKDVYPTLNTDAILDGLTIQTDASGMSIAVVLTQEEEGGEHPIVFISRMTMKQNITTP